MRRKTKQWQILLSVLRSNFKMDLLINNKFTVSFNLYDSHFRHFLPTGLLTFYDYQQFYGRLNDGNKIRDYCRTR